MISVIVPVYNGELLIERGLRSILNQNGDYELEILVIDDQSTDKGLEVVKNLTDSRIRIFTQERNQGPAAARNRGIAEARGEYCAFLDADDYWSSDFLKETASFLMTHPETVAVSVMQCHKIPGKPDTVSPRWDGDDAPRQLTDFFDFWAKYNHVCTGSVLMRTRVARQTGGQREDLRICEDLEFWALLATYGDWGFIPKVLFTSDGGEVTRQIGWLTKNRKRWASAVPMSEWSRRLDHRVVANLQPSYAKAKGRIARNMSYSLLLSGRIGLAREEVKRYGTDFPSSRLSQAAKMAAKNPVLWYLWCKLLYWRECLR